MKALEACRARNLEEVPRPVREMGKNRSDNKWFLGRTGHARLPKIRTRGKRYQISEGDGLFYSYSVYDSYDLLADWSEELLIFPAGKCDARSWFHPLLTAPGVILIAIRNRRADPQTT